MTHETLVPGKVPILNEQRYQLKVMEGSSRDRGEPYINLALLMDGLRAEREQGITIDVAAVLRSVFSEPAHRRLEAHRRGEARAERIPANHFDRYPP